MARTYGGNADYSLAGTWIEGWLDSITINMDVPVADITSFTDAYQNVKAGKKNVTTELTGIMDTVSATVDDIIFNRIGAGPTTSKFEPAGATTCYYQCASSGLTGTLVTKYTISLPVGDKAKFSASLQNSGNTTRETT